MSGRELLHVRSRPLEVWYQRLTGGEGRREEGKRGHEFVLKPGSRLRIRFIHSFLHTRDLLDERRQGNH